MGRLRAQAGRGSGGGRTGVPVMRLKHSHQCRAGPDASFQALNIR